jgi:DNA-binding IclR family transcriptional regulator
VVSANPLRYDVELESLRPAHSTSIGRVLLAALPDDALDDYFREHALSAPPGRPAPSERTVRRALRQAREDGYVTIADSHVVGTSGAAAPVIAAGATIAGLAIIAPTARLEAARHRIVPRVVAAARGLGRAIGGSAA